MAEPKSDPVLPQSITRIMLRPYGSALPLGCFAFGFGNCLFSAMLLHWLPPSDTRIVAVMLLGFAAPLEMIPCILAFLSRDSGAATAMGVFSASWIVQGIALLLGGQASTSPAMGIFLLLTVLFLGILIVVSYSAKPLFGVLLAVALLRSLAAALVEFGMAGPVPTVVGGLGLLLAAFAFYCGLAFLMEDIRQQPLAMTFRRKKAKSALEGGLQQQLERVTSEAGVRQQL